MTPDEFDRASCALLQDYLLKASPEQRHIYVARRNYDDSPELLAWLADRSELDRATALMMYWSLGAAWFITFAAAQFPVGWALDRLGPRRTVGTAMAIGTAGAFLFATSENAWVAVFAMGLVGIGCSPIFMSALYLFARTQDVARFGVLPSALLG